MQKYKLKLKTTISNLKHHYDVLDILLPTKNIEVLEQKIDKISALTHNLYFMHLHYSRYCLFQSVFSKQGIFELNQELLKLNRIKLEDIDAIFEKVSVL